MKTSRLPTLFAAVSTITSAHSQTTTPDSVKTRIGDLNFEKGFPTEETTKKLSILPPGEGTWKPPGIVKVK